MKDPLHIKEVLLTIFYLVALIIMISILDYVLYLLLKHIVFHLLNWFNGLSLFFKLFFLSVGGFALISFSLDIFRFASAIINMVIFKYFPLNLFTFLASILACLLNIFCNIWVLWLSFPAFNFWLGVEFIFLCGFVISFNASFIRTYSNE